MGGYHSTIVGVKFYEPDNNIVLRGIRDYFMQSRKNISIVILLFVIGLLLSSCNSTETSVDNFEMTNVIDASNQKVITKEMAYNGINNYCHKSFDWDVAKGNPDIMYVEMGEETDTEYQVIFKSYTGSFIYFYVNKSDGKTKIVEYVPAMNIKEEAGKINLFDYLDKDN